MTTTCRSTGLPYVRHITLRDATPRPDDSLPVHVLCKPIEFDGEPVKARIRGEVMVELFGRRDATRVTFLVHVDDCTPPFQPDDPVTDHAPATISGHPFLAPAGVSWDAVDDAGDFGDYGGAIAPTAYPVADPDGPWVECVVFVAKVSIE